MTTAAPLPTPVEVKPDEFSYLKFGASTCMLGLNLYMATTPAQVFLASGRYLNPYVKQIPSWGPTLANGLEWGTTITAAVVDPTGFCASYAVRASTEWAVGKGTDYIARNVKDFSAEDRQQLISVCVFAADVFLTPYVKGGFDYALTAGNQYVDVKINFDVDRGNAFLQKTHPDFAKGLFASLNYMQRTRLYQGSSDTFSSLASKYTTGRTILYSFTQRTTRHPLAPQTVEKLQKIVNLGGHITMAALAVGIAAGGTKEAIRLAQQPQQQESPTPS